MSITGIRLRNFRGFRNAALQLKPLTVLLGPNSAGKSSFGHALVALAHAQKEFATGLASLTPSGHVEDWPVDLGITSDLRTRGADGPVCIELQTRGGAVEFGFGGVSHTPNLELNYLMHPSDEFSSAAPTPPPKTAKPSSDVGATSIIRFDQVISEPNRMIRLKKINEFQWRDGDSEASVILQGLILKAVTHLTGSPRVVSGQATTVLQDLFRALTYLRPNRQPPCRRYVNGVGVKQQIGYSGEFTSSVIHRNRGAAISYAMPPNIPSNDEEARLSAREWRATTDSLASGLDWWLTHFGLARKVDAVPIDGSIGEIGMRVSLQDQVPHDITEVGFGVSQVIPVVVAGLLQPPESLFIVDLPEAHLHPRPQALVADFFCSLAMSGRTVLVETHSEMFFHRLRLRAAMNHELAERIAVYFIDAPRDGECVLPRQVGLGYEDELRWPEGFLQEAWETESQISLVRGSDQTSKR